MTLLVKNLGWMITVSWQRFTHWELQVNTTFVHPLPRPVGNLVGIELATQLNVEFVAVIPQMADVLRCLKPSTRIHAHSIAIIVRIPPAPQGGAEEGITATHQVS